MKRPLTTNLSAPPLKQAEAREPEVSTPSNWRDLAPIASALIAILSAMESGPKAGPAVKAYRSAIRRHGQEAATISGPNAMEAVLRSVADAAPDRAARREAIIGEAWTGLPGWRPEERQP